jgi:ABC-2 type transport system permease protein
MRTMLRLGWLEIKLFLREPITVVVTLALPLVLLFILGGVFGNEPSAPGEEMVWRGMGPMTFYVPAYVVLVVASVGLISIPTHLAGNRERGVLRRYRASAIGAPVIAGAELVVALVVSSGSALVLVGAASLTYDFSLPDSPMAVAAAFVCIVAGFTALGLLLGALMPTARAAQALGLLAWFVMLLVGGAGPPHEVLSAGMRVVANATPMLHAVRIVHQPWLGLDPGGSWLWFGLLSLVSLALALRLFRWE